MIKTYLFPFYLKRYPIMIFILVDFFLFFFFTFFDGVILKKKNIKWHTVRVIKKKIAKSSRQRRDFDISIKKNNNNNQTTSSVM